MTTTTEAERVVKLKDGPLAGDTQVINEFPHKCGTVCVKISDSPRLGAGSQTHE